MRSWRGIARLRAAWHDMVDSLWFLPSLLTIGAAGLAVLLVRMDSVVELDAEQRTDLWWLFGGGAEGARGVLGAIAGSIITVTGVVFSVTIVALQLASSQFTPRVLRQFMGSRANQLVLGVFIGTFTYTLLVQRTVRGATDDVEVFVPAIAVTGAVLLALLSIAFLIFFINHAARSIQASVVIDNITRDTLRILRLTYPADEPRGPAVAVPANPPRTVAARRCGYVQAVAGESLCRTAAQHDLLVRVERRPGDFVLEGQVLLAAWTDGDLVQEAVDDLAGAIHIGPERTPHQDLGLGVVELVDVAVKALSPSVNDPTTALNVIDRLGEILLALARHADGERQYRDEEGRLRVLLPRPPLADLVELGVQEIRHYGVETPSVMVRLINMLADVGELAPVEVRGLFRGHITETIAAASRAMQDPEALQRVSDAAVRATARFGGGAPPPLDGGVAPTT